MRNVAAGRTGRPGRREHPRGDGRRSRAHPHLRLPDRVHHPDRPGEHAVL